MIAMNRQKVKDFILTRLKQKRPHELYPIPEFLFEIHIGTGVSLETVKELVTEVFRENQTRIRLTKTSDVWFWHKSMDGRRGEERIKKWYLKINGTFRSHFVVLERWSP